MIPFSCSESLVLSCCEAPASTALLFAFSRQHEFQRGYYSTFRINVKGGEVWQGAVKQNTVSVLFWMTLGDFKIEISVSTFQHAYAKLLGEGITFYMIAPGDQDKCFHLAGVNLKCFET